MTLALTRTLARRERRRRWRSRALTILVAILMLHACGQFLQELDRHAASHENQRTLHQEP